MSDPGQRKTSDLGQTQVKVDGMTQVKPRLSPSGAIVFTTAGAATACGVSPETIKRAREAGKVDGAYQETTGRKQWLLPLPGLLAAGFEPQTPTADLGQKVNKSVAQTQVRPRSEKASDPGQTQVTDDRATALEAELADLRAQLADEKTRRAVAEAKVDGAREAADIHKQRADEAVRALLMLGPGPTPQPEPLQAHPTPETTPTTVVGQVPERGRFRLFGRRQ